MTKPFGLHVIIDLKGCSNKKNLTSQSNIYDLLKELPKKIDMTLMTLPYVCKWKDKFSKGTEGISGFVMIAESHISVHTFPDQNYVFVDVFSCRDFDSKKTIKIFKDFFKPKSTDENVVIRGNGFYK